MYICMDEWMDGWIDVCTGMYEWTAACMHGWMHE